MASSRRLMASGEQADLLARLSGCASALRSMPTSFGELAARRAGRIRGSQRVRRTGPAFARLVECSAPPFESDPAFVRGVELDASYPRYAQQSG